MIFFFSEMAQRMQKKIKQAGISTNVDFGISPQSAATASPTINNQVIISFGKPASQSPEYPTVELNTQSAPMFTPAPEPITAPLLQNPYAQVYVTSYDLSSSLVFQTKIRDVLTEYLTSNNHGIIINIIDTSGLIILKSQDLVEIIACALNVSSADVVLTYIDYEDDKAGCLRCLRKVQDTIIKQVKAIKIGSVDLKTSQNEAYNILSDQYKISMKRVLML
jgi:hypothetical protein